MASVFAREVSFFSIGTNDLIQYTLAVDRGNERVANLYTAGSPAVIHLIKNIIRAGKRFNVDTSLCGEIAGRPLEAMALAGLGYRRLSMTSPGIGPVKAMIRQLELMPLRQRMAELVDEGVSASDVRTELRAWAAANGIPV